MQKVAAAEILHTQSNVNHELQKCLSGQELRKKTRVHLDCFAYNIECVSVYIIVLLDSLPGVTLAGNCVDLHIS